MIPNFATELENPDDIMELQKDINKLVEWAKREIFTNWITDNDS